MHWTFVFCILISSAFIASSSPDESRHKRGLSFLKSLFFHDMRRTLGKCTKTSQCKPTKEKQTAVSDRQKNGALQVSERGRDENKRKQTRTKAPKVGNNESSSTNFANEPYQAESRALGTTNTKARTTTKYSDNESPQNIQNLCDNKLMVNGELRETNPFKNCNINQNIYETPIIYAFEQPNSEIVQPFALENNVAFIEPENFNQLQVPGYIDDGLGNIIWSVPPYPHPPSPSFVSEQYEHSIMSPYVLLDHQQGNFGMNMLPNNYMSMYAGKPIVVMEDTPEKNKPSELYNDSEINKDIDRKRRQKYRGDIPD